MPLVLDLPALAAPVETVDVEAERQDAYNEGHRAATEALTAQHADELAALKDQHAAEMEAQREQLEGGIADYLAKALPELAQRVSTELADAAAGIFLPLIKEQVARRAMSDLADEMKPMLAKGILGQMKVSGPDHLCDLLRTQLGEAGDDVEFAHADMADLRVEIGDSLLVTRLSVFAEDVEKVLV
jgi:hypothetical protein